MQLSDSWERGDAYERYIGRWSRQLAPLFLEWLRYPPGQRWLDVGCGTGALCAAIVNHCLPSWVAGVEPSEGFLQVAEESLADRVTFYPGSATEIPLDADAVDIVVSGLVLNFVTDPEAALREMARVTRPGGAIGAYVWDYAGKMEYLRLFWDTVIALHPDAASLDEGIRFPLCQPTALITLFGGASLHDIEVTALDLHTHFASFDDFWTPFLGGQGPAPAYLLSLESDAIAELRERLRERVPEQGDGSIDLIARAWGIRAIVLEE